MAKGGVQIVLDGDEAKLFESLQRVISQEKKAEVGAKEFGRTASKINADVQKKIESMGLSLTDYTKLQSVARREVDASKNATERYADKVQETDRQLKLGIITDQQRVAILKRSRDALFGVSEAEAKETRAVKDSTRSLRENETARKGAVGETSLSGVAKFAGAWLAVGAAVTKATGFISGVIQQVNQLREASGDNLIGLEGSTQRLRQVATSSEDLDSLVSRADNASADSGVNRATSRELLFSARSEGFEDEFERVLALKPVLDPVASAKVAGGIRNLFSDEKLGVEGTLNAVLSASQKSKFSFEDVSQALPAASEGGAMQGATLAETSATLAVIDDGFESASTAAARIKALTTKLALDKEFGLAGKGLIGGVEGLQNLPEKDRRKFLGESQEVNAAFIAITKRFEEIKTTTKEVESAIASAGTEQSTVMKQAAAALDENTRAGRQAIAVRRSLQAEIKKEISTEGRAAVTALDQKSTLDELDAKALEQGDSYLKVQATRTIANTAINTSEALGMSVSDERAAQIRDISGQQGGFSAFGSGTIGVGNLIADAKAKQAESEGGTDGGVKDVLVEIRDNQQRANGAALGALGDDK